MNCTGLDWIIWVYTWHSNELLELVSKDVVKKRIVIIILMFVV